MSAYTPLEPITTVDTISTFDDWRVLTNQIISRVNNASSSNTSADYSELISRLVVRDENAAFVANNISGNNFTANVSYFFLANGEQTNTNTAVTASGFYAGEWDRATNTYGSSATSSIVDPITDPSGIRSMICRTTDAILIPRGTSGQAPINPEAGMLRFDTTMSTLTFWNDSTVSWKTLGGGELGDRDVDTVIKVENAPGTDEDTISMYVGNTGTAFPVFTINAATTNTTINAVFKDYVLFEKDITISGNLTILGQQSSVDATSLAIEDRLVNIGMVNGLRNGCVGLSDGANLRIRMPNIQSTTGTGAQVPHGLNLDELVWITNVNDIQNVAEGLYKVEAIHDIYEFTIENVDGTAVGAIVGTFSPTVSWAGPQSDSSVNQGGLVLPGNTEHSLKWTDTDQYFVFSDNMRIDNTAAFGLPVGNSGQRPNLSGGSGDNAHIDDYKGSLRYNSELNALEAIMTSAGGGTTKHWATFHSMIDSDDGSDTFINVYGNDQIPTAVVSAPGHTLNDIVFVTDGTERFFIDNLGYGHFTSNGGLVIPKGTTAEQPRFPSLDTGGDTTSHTDAQGDGMQVAMIRFNTELNVYEDVFADDSSTDILRFMPLGSGTVDTGSGSGNNTFLSVYGNDVNPFSHDPAGTHVGIQGNAVHTLDDTILTIAGTKRFFVDSTGWASFTSNSVLQFPRGTTAQRPTNVAGGLDAGSMRFNMDSNALEVVLGDGLTWSGAGGLADSADGSDTFISPYGNMGNATGTANDASHVLNDMSFVTASSEEMLISANSWISLHTSANSVVRMPIGTTAQRPSATGTGKRTGSLRFNTDINSLEMLMNDGSTWTGLGILSDIQNGGDTFINPYGATADAANVTSDSVHTENDLVFVTNSHHIMTIDKGSGGNHGNVYIGDSYNIGDSSHKSNAPDARFKVKGTANVTGVVVFNDTFTVNGAVDFDSTLNTDGVVTFNSTLDVDGGTTLNSTLDVDGATTLNSSLDVDGHSEHNSTMNVDGATTIGSTLGVTTSITVPTINGTSGSLQVNGATQINLDTGASNFDMTDTAIVITGTRIDIGDDSNDTVRIRPGSSAASNRILQCTDGDGNSTWIDFGVFDASGNRLI